MFEELATIGTDETRLHPAITNRHDFNRINVIFVEPDESLCFDFLHCRKTLVTVFSLVKNLGVIVIIDLS